MAKKGINQKKLSELSGIQRATISNIMRGKSSGSFATICLLAKALCVSVTEILED